MSNETHTAVTLNPLTLPLHGHRLIEASAGTGKTWTIAALYLRLLLGHGREPGSAREALTVDQILVVTFTEVATEELRDRIRGRIHEARQAFLDNKTDDSYLQHLLDDLDQHPLQAERLLAAERQMDEAAIFTIHGFCQRMLKQHAFESGTLFTSELMEDQSELMADAVADFWRRTMYPLDYELAALARGLWPSPAALQSELERWLNQHNLTIDEQLIPSSLAALEARISEVKATKALWREQQSEILSGLEAVLKKNSKSWKRLQAMCEFAAGPELEPKTKKEVNWPFYTPEALAKACRQGQCPPDLSVFEKIDDLCRFPLELTEAFKSLILRDALKDVGTRLHQRRLELRKMSFDDLLTRLDQALCADGGAALAQHIRSNFAVGMIDEFQDTDSIQYRIFSHLYPLRSQNDHQHEPDAAVDHGLFLIGDPKQAIYAFRGADIFTYIQAKKQISHHYTLPRNWRSSASMITASNHLFAQAESAFVYDNDIPFLPVEAAPGADQRGLLIDGQPHTALQLLYQHNEGQSVGKGDYEQTMADCTSHEINRLLTLAKENRCQAGSTAGARPLVPGDIAVLVRTGTQAKKIQQALADQNIASVYMSDRSSVFDAPEATDLCRLLAACLEPTSERKLRAALATQLLGLQASTLDQLNNSEQHWEDAVEEFSEYHQQWLQRGVLPMLRLMIARRNLAENLLAEINGERRLTDLLHLGELLAAAAREKDSPHALLRWLQERIVSPDQNAKEQQLHLESEQKLVRIVTIHKSKGLEYGVVFIPFACTWRAQEQGIYHDENQQIIADLIGQDEAIARADKERLAEDLRLLYVALTRAIHACYLGIAPVKLRGRGGDKTDLAKTALGYLLSSNSEITADALTNALNRLEDDCPSITVAALPEPCDQPYSPPEQPQPTLSAQTFTGHIPGDWWLTSYSALSRNASHSQRPTTPDASHEQPGLDLEVQGQHQEQAVLERAPFSSLFDFPRGARPGTFLHEIFERVAFEQPDPATIAEMINDQLLVNGLDQQWQPVLQTMVETVISAPMNDEGLTLNSLQAGHYKPELEFNLSLGTLQAHNLNTLLQAHDPLAAQAGELNFPRVQGLLKGFIDLTFQANGKWYVLDWKSNWLGDATSAYSRDAMAAAMIDHRYDLQYLIYTLALHRHLKVRLPDYDYEKHLGGAFYIFLRGVEIENTGASDERSGIYFHRPDKTLIEALDRLFAGQSQEVAPC